MTEDETKPVAIPMPRRPGRPPKLKLFPREPAQPKVTPLPKPDAMFDGMTATICASGCSEKGCVVTGDVCGHPYKSGLQAKHYMQKEVMARYERAKDFLKHQAIDKRREA